MLSKMPIPLRVPGTLGVKGHIGPGTQQATIVLTAYDVHMAGCQNYGPFLGPYYNTTPNI